MKVFCPKLFSTVCKKTYLIAVAHTTSHLSQNLSYIHNEITKNVLLIWARDILPPVETCNSLINATVELVIVERRVVQE